MGFPLVLLRGRRGRPGGTRRSRATTCCCTRSASAGGRRAGGLDTRSLTKRVDGLLALNVPLADKSVVSLRDLRVPVVTVGTAVEGMSGVLVDNVEVGRQATQHLLDLGHRRIAFFGDDLDEMHGFTAAGDRHRGYDLTLREAGIEPDPALVQRTGFSMDGGEAARAPGLRSGRAAGDLPTAVFAVSDEVAMGVLYAARRARSEGAEGSVGRRRRRPRLRLPVRSDDHQPAGPRPGPDRRPAAAGTGQQPAAAAAVGGLGRVRADPARHHRSAARRAARIADRIGGRKAPREAVRAQAPAVDGGPPGRVRPSGACRRAGRDSAGCDAELRP